MQIKSQIKSQIKQRILQYIDYKNVSRRVFYEKTGISRGTLENNASITEDTMAKFVTAYPDVSVNWLVTGEGEMNRSHIDSESMVATPVTSCISMDVKDLVSYVSGPKDEVISSKDEVISSKDEVISSKDEVILIMKKYITALEKIAETS